MVYLPFEPWLSSASAPAPGPVAHRHPSARPHWPGLGVMRASVLPVETAPLEDCWVWYSFSYPHISSEFSFVIFCLKALPPQESAWPQSCSPETVPSGTPTVPLMPCQWYGAVIYQALSVEQFDAGCIVDNINNPCFACTTPGAPGEVVHTEPQGSGLFAASPSADYVCARQDQS